MTDQPQETVRPLTLISTLALTKERWDDALAAARRDIQAAQPRPNLSEYLIDTAQEFPRWLTLTLGLVLALLAMGALYVSAGKQLAAADRILQNVLTQTNRVSEFWVTTSLLALLLVGEVGALTFSLAASIFGRTPSARRLFRGFMLASAGIALLGNATVTFLKPMPDMLAYQWFLTLFLPGVVLGVGFVFEALLLRHLEQRAKATAAYNEALAAWQRAQMHPDQHPDFGNFLARNVLAALRLRQPAAARRSFDRALAEDSRFAEEVILRELQTHWRPYNRVGAYLANPDVVQLPETVSKSVSERPGSRTETGTIAFEDLPRATREAVEKLRASGISEQFRNGLEIPKYRELSNQLGVSAATLTRAFEWLRHQP